MDENVKLAMAKWPNVPHCYGWLALDARGCWRMRDERAQALDLPGDKIVHTALLGFINRNYTHDDQGRWYFQNGPQRVYVNLEATPYIARTDPAQGFILHTGEPLFLIDAAWMTETGQLVLQADEKIAMVDDRDMLHYMSDLRMNGTTVSDDQLMAWLHQPETTDRLSLKQAGRQVPVRHIGAGAMPAQFGFVPAPRPDSASRSTM